MILIQRLKKIKRGKAFRSLMFDIVFYLVFFILGGYFVFTKIHTKEPEILILENNAVENVLESQEIVKNTPKGASFVASSRGKYFYPIGSNRANSLKEENRIYFNTEEEAKKLGFKPYSGI